MNRTRHNLKVHTALASDHTGSEQGFTMLELLLAVAIFSIVLVAINTVFFASMRLHRSVTASLDAVTPLNHALAVIRKDLQNAIGPAGTLAGNFRSGGPAGVALGSTPGATTGGSLATPLGAGGAFQGAGLDFFTTTGLLRDDAPYGEIQEVNYRLLPSDAADATGKDLVRSVTRNLLTYATPTVEMQRLAGKIDELEFQYYDGTQWRDTWDTSIGDVGLPAAVRVRIQLVPEKESPVAREPIEMMVLLSSNIGTNTVAMSDSESQ